MYIRQPSDLSHRSFSEKPALFLKYLLFLLSVVIISACASSNKFSGNDYTETSSNSLNIKVLLNEQSSSYSFVVDESVYLKKENKTAAQVKAGNKIQIYSDGGSLNVLISGKSFRGKYFSLEGENNGTIQFNQKRYRGRILIRLNNNNIKMENELNLEDYLKGVVPSEMPVGLGNSSFEALKAFVVCARTYAYNKINSSGFIFADVRDQVYNGADGETQFSNSAVDETSGEILTFNAKPAIVYYHSTCGGATENIDNVFTPKRLPYLKGVKDNYCTISPKYEWTEVFPESVLVKRLSDAGMADGKEELKLDEIKVNSRFESGRVNDLEIKLINDEGEESVIHLYGNNIRSVIRSADSRSILYSTLFVVSKDLSGNIILSGKGYGHGAGMCQWGAIGMSQDGKEYRDILKHYFPGTATGILND